MNVIQFHSVWTAVLLVCFIGIVVWVFVLHRKSDFDEAARLALDEEPNEPNEPNGKRTDG